jgi:hypothetical protein
MKKSLFITSILVFTVFVCGLIFQNTSQVFVEQSQIQPETLKADVKAQIQEKQKASEEYGRLPINFESNVGQTDEQVKFLARGHGYSLFLTDAEAVLALRKSGKIRAQDKSAVVRMQIQGANSKAKTIALGETQSKSNYFIGEDSQKWQTNVPNYGQVKYEQIFSGVDLVFYGSNQQLEYDFLVQPNANPNQIKLNFGGVESAKIDKVSGDLLLETNAGTIRQQKPLVYQNIDGERREIASSYSIQNSKANNFTVSFNLAEYDKSKELVIDPILAYGSYLGGNDFDEGRAIAVDAQGNAYVVGTAASRDFPTTAGTIKPVLLPRADAPNSFLYDAFVTKINPSGTAIVFSTYYGGQSGNETGSGVAVDQNGNVLISGTTMSSDLPTVSAYQTTFGGTDDAFAAKLSSTGSSIIYSTYLGGNNTDTGGKIALNQTTGDAVFAGTSSSPNFPTTAGAYKQKLCDSPQTCSGIFYSGSYAVKLSANGAAIYSTLFDAAVNDVALDASDDAVLGGSAGTNFQTTPGAFQTASSGGTDGFIAKLNPNGSALLYGTFLGGGLQSDRVKSIALDAAQNIYATGQTQNTAFPTTAGAFDQTYNGGEDGFVTKLNPSGSALVYSTFLGGAGKDEPFGIALGADDSAFVVGETTGAASFPLRNSLNGAAGTIFLTRLNASGSALVFSTMLGQGGGYDVATDSSNSAFVTGSTTSGVLVTPNAFQTVKGGGISDKDGYVIKIAPTDENQTFYTISGTVTDENYGYNNDYTPVVVTVTGTVTRSVNLPYNGGQYNFGVLPSGGNYTITARKVGYVSSPQNAVFNNLGANQFADFTILRNQAPEGVITSPAHDTTYDAPATINITATASDPDGDAITKIDFVAYGDAGTINIATDTTAPYEATWTNVPVGTYALYAYPTDAKGLRGDSIETVHVFVYDTTAPNVALTSPGNNSTFHTGDYIDLNASVSSSIQIVEYYANDELIARRTNAPWSSYWRPLETGTYAITAKGYTATNQAFTSNAANVTIAAFNHRISGRITNAESGVGIANVSVALTGTNSISATVTTDSNGNYLFTDFNGTPDDSVTITPTLAGQTFSPANISISYLGYVDWQYENFTTAPLSGVTVQLTSPTGSETYNAPATVNIAANASTSGGAIAKVEFFYTTGDGVRHLLSTDTTAPYSFSWTGVAAGAYYLIAKATDTNGSSGEDSTFISVSSQPATVRINGQVRDANGNGMQGVTVNLSGSQTQTWTTISGGYFVFNNLPTGGNYTVTPVRPNTTFAPQTLTFSNLTSDAVDADFVADTTNQAPTVQINSPSNGAVYQMPAAIPFNVTAADSDGQVVHLTVTAQNDFQAFTVGQSNSGTFNAPWQPTQPGVYTVYAQARDNGGLLTTTQVSITVTAPAPVSISGRIVDRSSVGIEAVTLELMDYPQELGVVATATTDASGNYTIPNVATLGNYILRASKQDYTFAPQQRVFTNVAANQTNADFTGTLQVQPSDFDGDGKTDMAVWRPSTGVWYVNRSSDQSYTSLQFGGESFGDTAVPGNFDGDRKTDYAVFRRGVWYILNSSNAQIRTVQFGFATDKPVAGDFDGDGKTDIAVYRPETGVWYIQRSSDNGYDIRTFGLNGDVPLAADYDGDGICDLTVWRPSNGVWYVLQSSNGEARSYQFGRNGDTPLVGDFDGDKRADYTIFRASEGVWYVNLSSTGGFKILQWGIATDIPVPGDFDRDGKTDFGVFRKSEGNWYVYLSSNNSYVIQNFGLSGDMPVPAAYR